MAGIFDLLPFLQQSSADIFKEDPTRDILVTGQPTTGAPTFEDDPAPRPLGNRSAIEEARGVLANAPQRSGMFGTKGTLRNILGTLGDAFLVQSGNKPVFAPQVEQERQMDALAGITQDPLAAIERLAQANPEMATKVFDQFQQNQFRTATAGRQQANLERQEAKDAAALKYRKLQIAQNMISAAGTPEEQQAVRDWLANDDADLNNLPAHIVAAGGINRYQQEMIPVQQSRAVSARISATRPPAPRATPQPTPSSLFERYTNIPESKRTPEQKAFIKKFTSSGRGSTTLTPRPGTRLVPLD